jgi:hypothetical protein
MSDDDKILKEAIWDHADNGDGSVTGNDNLMVILESSHRRNF